MDAPRPHDPQPPEPAPDRPHPTAAAVLVEVASSRLGPTRTVTTYTYSCEPTPPTHALEYDPEPRVIRLTGPDGQASAFRDDPVRFLVVERDPEMGRPMLQDGMGRPNSSSSAARSASGDKSPHRSAHAR